MIRVWASSSRREDEEAKNLGEYEWVQLTYNFLKAAPDGDDLLVLDGGSGVWFPTKRTPFEGSPWYEVGPDLEAESYTDIVLEVVK